MSYDLVSVVLPVYKQAAFIDRTVSDYEEHLEKLAVAHELILVVNGPRDGTYEACARLADAWPTVRATESEKGWGHAVRHGLSEADGDLLCFTNSARTAPEDLTLLLLYALAYPGVVVKANRRVRDSWRRRLGSLLYNLESRALFDLANFDVNGTPKVFPRACDRLLDLKREDDLIDLEFNVACRQQDYPMVEVPILATRRHGGKSTTNYKSAIHMYAGAYELWRVQRRGR